MITSYRENLELVIFNNIYILCDMCITIYYNPANIYNTYNEKLTFKNLLHI